MGVEFEYFSKICFDTKAGESEDGKSRSCAVMQTSDCDKIVTRATLPPPRPAPPHLSALIQVDTSLASPGLMSHYITQVRGKNMAKVTWISVYYFISN